VQNADFGILRHSMDSQQKKEHLMKSGISGRAISGRLISKHPQLRRFPSLLINS
jgi:hypothetical protein